MRESSNAIRDMRRIMNCDGFCYNAGTDPSYSVNYAERELAAEWNQVPAVLIFETNLTKPAEPNSSHKANINSASVATTNAYGS